MSASAPLEPFDSFLRSWTGLMLAPQKLMQSFNNGWSFANLTINSMNSSAPDTEQAIVAVESYGRQIGKLLDAVDLLVKQQSDWREHSAFSEVDALKRRGRGRPGRGSEPAQVVALRLTADELAALDARAARENKSRSELIREAIAAYAA